jgi:hypothetical protein
MKPDLSLGCITILMSTLLIANFPVMAAEVNGVSAFHVWGITDIITIFTTLLAVILGVISFVGYRRDQRSKFLLVTLAFSIFALKGVFVLSGDLLALRNPLFDPLFDIIASLLDFAVLACIFLSIAMK